MMTQKRQTALQLTLLAIAMAALVILSAAGPAACAPAAPAEQASGQAEAEDATATAEPTATSAADATDTPTPEPTATTAATSTPTPEATPSPTGAPFTLRREITSEFLRDSFDRYQSAQSAGAAGAAGNAGQNAEKYPDTALVVINTNRIDKVMTFLAGKGIAPLDKVNGRPVSEITTTNADIVAEVPLALLPELSQQWVGSIEHANPYYPVLSNGVNHYLVRYQAGLPLDGEFLWLDITVRKGQSSDNLKQFLMDNRAVWGDYDTFVPLSLLERLALRSEPERIVFIGGPFTTELIYRVRDALTRTPTPIPEPTPAAEG